MEVLDLLIYVVDTLWLPVAACCGLGGVIIYLINPSLLIQTF
jgi:hypothetical protein